jgi:hypothetical protein
MAARQPANHSDGDLDEFSAALQRDVIETVGAAHGHLVADYAAASAHSADGRTWYMQKVVNDVQQRLHDTFIDVTWPACPRHPTHPLGFQGGWWVCPKDRARVAKLGRLRD